MSKKLETLINNLSEINTSLQNKDLGEIIDILQKKLGTINKHNATSYDDNKIASYLVQIIAAYPEILDVNSNSLRNFAQSLKPDHRLEKLLPTLTLDQLDQQYKPSTPKPRSSSRV